MKKNNSTKHIGLECTEANIKKYANRVFAVRWLTAEGKTCTILCTKLSSPHEPFENWFTAQGDYGMSRSFLINDKNVRIIIK